MVEMWKHGSKAVLLPSYNVLKRYVIAIAGILISWYMLCTSIFLYSLIYSTNQLEAE